MRYFLVLFSMIFMLFLSSCESSPKQLPILGNPEIVDGQEIPHHIPPFSFTNQNGKTITNADFKDKIYVSNFFFTTCPSICPLVSRQMLRIYDAYEQNDQVLLLSHSLDPKRDSIEALKAYAENMDVKAPKWNFVTGEKKVIRGMAENYFNIVVEDDEAPGGINHDGKIILIDKSGRIRSFCEGTDADEVTKFMEDIETLLAEYEQQ